MRVRLNGEERDVTSADLAALLGELEYETDHVAIAVNHEVVPRARWATTDIAAGDAIEIITPRQGG